jgi:hypothetical protein
MKTQLKNGVHALASFFYSAAKSMFVDGIAGADDMDSSSDENFLHALDTSFFNHNISYTD